ncbi:MAG: hypothetical protein R2825_06080 [Saprospiraceae bacterium]
MTKTYKLKNDSFEEKKKEILKRGIVLSIIAVLGGFTISIINSGFDLKVFLIMIPIAGIAMFIGLRRGIKLQKQAWESFEIKWDSDTIIKSQIRTNVVSIQKNEILEIVENKYGAIVKSGNNSNSFFIPKELEQYSELINELRPK